MSDDFLSADDLRAWVEQGVHEPTAEERLAAWERQVRAEELRVRLEAEEDEAWEDERDRRHRRRNRRIVAAGWLVVFALIAGLLVRTFALSDDRRAASAWAALDRADVGTRVGSGEMPSPPISVSPTPLGAPIDAPSKRGPYEFVSMQPGSDAPVTYDPCRPIHYVVNHTGQPNDAENLVTDAIERISEVTGLQFVADDLTDEEIVPDRQPYQPDRYGDRWAPVLIAWGTPDDTPLLAGSVAGFGGSTQYTVTDQAGISRSVYVTGEVVLDGPQIANIIRLDRDGLDGARAVVLHELAHVVGLDHVDDPTQLMNPVSQPGVTDFAAGDLRGLRQLGLGACVPGI